MAKIPISFVGGGGGGSDEVTASSAQVLKGYTAITTNSNDEPIEGTIPIKNAKNYYAKTEDQIIALNQYLAGNQTIKGVSQANLSAENIKKGTTISVSNGNGNLFSVEGSYSTPSDGQSPIIAGAIRSGFSGFVNGGAEIQGAIPNQAAKTVYASTSQQTAVPTGYYTTGAVNVAALSQSNLASGNICRGNTISINNGQSNVWSVSGASNVYKMVSGSFDLSTSSRDGTIDISHGGYTGTYWYKDISVPINPITLFSYGMCYKRDTERVECTWIMQSIYGMFITGDFNSGVNFFPATKTIRLINRSFLNMDTTTVYYTVFGT